MTNTASVDIASTGAAESPSLCKGIEFDDQDSTPEERRLEATRQALWGKVLKRFRAELSGKTMNPRTG